MGLPDEFLSLALAIFCVAWLIGCARLRYGREQARLLLPYAGREAPRLGQIIERDVLAMFEKRIHPLAVRLLKQLVDVGRPNANLTREGALRGTRAALESRLPREQLDDSALAVGTQAFELATPNRRCEVASAGAEGVFGHVIAASARTTRRVRVVGAFTETHASIVLRVPVRSRPRAPHFEVSSRADSDALNPVYPIVNKGCSRHRGPPACRTSTRILPHADRVLVHR
jgi:hypothetical protein